MKRVYTKTGDKGTTGIHGGARVPKDDIRIERDKKALKCDVKDGLISQERAEKEYGGC